MSELILPLALAAVMATAVPLHAWRKRGRTYATFAAVILGLSLPGLVAMAVRLPRLLEPPASTALLALLCFAIVAGGAHLALLVRARLRHWSVRLGLSVTGQAALAVGFFSSLWLLALLPVRGALLWLGAEGASAGLAWADFVPFAIAAVSLVTSTRPARETVRVELSDSRPEAVRRVPVQRFRRRTPAPLPQPPLRIVQITDPHLGPWQPVSKLRREVARLVEHEPDLVLLTGDFLTMESRGSPGSLADALSPLERMSERCFAIFGNHDHEDPDEVAGALAHNGIRLLVDEEIQAKTVLGPVQIIGADYVGRGREQHIPELLARFPRRDGELRLLMLHDPLGFQFVPKGAVDLTLSGHTHGGQVGLVSFGLDWTVLTRSRWPDHGLFGHGSNRLYVHRGTGFYGFPLRVGVPGEASLIELVLPEALASPSS